MACEFARTTSQNIDKLYRIIGEYDSDDRLVGSRGIPYAGCLIERFTGFVDNQRGLGANGASTQCPAPQTHANKSGDIYDVVSAKSVVDINLKVMVWQCRWLIHMENDHCMCLLC